MTKKLIPHVYQIYTDVKVVFEYLQKRCELMYGIVIVVVAQFVTHVRIINYNRTFLLKKKQC